MLGGTRRTPTGRSSSVHTEEVTEPSPGELVEGRRGVCGRRSGRQPSSRRRSLSPRRRSAPISLIAASPVRFSRRPRRGRRRGLPLGWQQGCCINTGDPVPGSDLAQAVTLGAAAPVAVEQPVQAGRAGQGRVGGLAQIHRAGGAGDEVQPLAGFAKARRVADTPPRGPEARPQQIPPWDPEPGLFTDHSCPPEPLQVPEDDPWQRLGHPFARPRRAVRLADAGQRSVEFRITGRCRADEYGLVVHDVDPPAGGELDQLRAHQGVADHEGPPKRAPASIQRQQQQILARPIHAPTVRVRSFRKQLIDCDDTRDR